MWKVLRFEDIFCYHYFQIALYKQTPHHSAASSWVRLMETWHFSYFKTDKEEASGVNSETMLENQNISVSHLHASSLASTDDETVDA